jgi:[ribosomal protein S18]-alanine N-acetyltransferase
MDWTVQRFGIPGAPLLAALHRLIFTEPLVTGPAWDEAAFAGLLTIPGCYALTAVRDHDPAALILLQQTPDEMEILTFGTVQSYRNRGAGRFLLLNALRQAAESGAESMVLEVAVTNVTARYLYQSCGFQPAGIRPRYFRFGDQQIDAVIMRADLSRNHD